jgi:hypothetical protein
MTPGDRVRFVAALVVISSVSQPPAADAQSAEAEVLFRDGRLLIKRGQLAEGCDKLAASERLESSVGTLLNLGDCREKLGRLASAWAAFRKAEAMARRAGGDDKRQSEAGRRAASLEPKLPSLVIQVPQHIDGLVVRRDAEIVDAAQWSTAMPVDPGRYTIVAEAPGYRAWHTMVPIAAGSGRQVVTVPALERAPVAVSTLQADGAMTEQVAAVRVTTRRDGTWTTARKVSAGAALVGAGALGAGVYFGMHANDLRDRADQRCPLAACADPEGLRLNDQAKTSATRANLLYVVGGATLATAVVLWLVGAPGETVVAPTAGDHQLGVAMAGSF